MPLPPAVNFFCGEFSPFLEKYFHKGIFCLTFLVVLEKKSRQQTKKNSKIAIIAYNMTGCLRFYTFIFLISHFF